jgi:hypothetical protein
MIPLKECLAIMDKKDPNKIPVPFSISFCTADLKKKTGGEILTIEKAVLAKNQEGVKETPAGIVAPATTKKANHWDNETRNIMLLPSKNIRKVHIRLITKLNGQTVYW